MADFLNPSTVPIPPAAEAIDDRVYTGPRPQYKKRPRVLKAGPVEESEFDEPEEGQPKHQLDLDA